MCTQTVAKNGDVCISILHEPGEDKFGYEKPEERWLPIHTVETIMISVISMLADPNSDSPANVDAAVSWTVCTSHPGKTFSSLCLESTLRCWHPGWRSKLDVSFPERVAGGPKWWIQEKSGSLCKKKSRDGVWLEEVVNSRVRMQKVFKFVVRRLNDTSLNLYFCDGAI